MTGENYTHSVGHSETTGIPWGITRKALADILAKNGISTIHSKNIFRSLYRSPFMSWGVEDRILPKKLLSLFGEKSKEKLSMDIVKTQRSTYDGSLKFVMSLFDGFEVETVLMPESSRITICLSTQVGCRQGCVFCHTGRMGLKRNLTTKEIIGQVILALQYIHTNPEWLKSLGFSKKQSITNVVFMGMGEPLDNVKNVIDAIRVLSDDWGLGIARRRITVSTAGKLDGFEEIYRELPNICFAFSLHAATNSARNRLMPINRKFDLEQLTDTLRQKFVSKSKSCMIQYTVIDGVNDCEKDAQDMIKLLEGIACKINLIPLNPISASRLQSPEPSRLETFRNLLHQGGLRVMIRYSKGQDIAAACGQLIR